MGDGRNGGKFLAYSYLSSLPLIPPLSGLPNMASILAAVFSRNTAAAVCCYIIITVLLNANNVSSFTKSNAFLLSAIPARTCKIYQAKLLSSFDNNPDRRAVIESMLIGSLLSPFMANAAVRDPKTGILLPSPGEIASAIPTVWDEDDNPFTSSSSTSFARLDSSPDTIFYSEPRFVEHVDVQAVESMTSYISDRLLQSGDSVLDLCSSWTSHISPSTAQKLKRVAALGMNAKELEGNPSLTDWTVLDLNANKDIKLPYEAASFDVVMCQLSIDYLVHPLEVMKETARVMKVSYAVCKSIFIRSFSHPFTITFSALNP